METREILKVLRLKKCGCRRERAIKMAAVYTLYKNGYKAGHIANAFGVKVTTIDYEYNTIVSLLETNDRIVKDAFEILKTHLLELRPYFIRKDGMFKIETYLTLDKYKL